MVSIRPLNIRAPSYNRRDTIEISVAELLREINSRFDSKPLVPLKNPTRPRPTPAPSPLFKPKLFTKPKSILKSSSTINVCSPDSACGSSWVVVHTNEDALQSSQKLHTLSRSVSFNDAELTMSKPVSTEVDSFVGTTPPNTPETPFLDLFPLPRITNMNNAQFITTPTTLSRFTSAPDQETTKAIDRSVKARPRATSTPVTLRPKQSRIVFPKPSPRHSRYKSRTYAEGTRPITRSNSVNSSELIWKPGWAGHARNNAGLGEKAKVKGVESPRSKWSIRGRNKSLPALPTTEKGVKNTIPFPVKRSSFSRSHTTFSSTSTLAALEDEKGFNLLDLVVKLKRKLARLSRKSEPVPQVQNGSIDEDAKETPKVEVKPRRKVSFVLPEERKDVHHHPAFVRRPSPYPREQITAAEEEDEGTDMNDETGTGNRTDSEQIRPLRRSDDFVLAM